MSLKQLLAGAMLASSLAPAAMAQPVVTGMAGSVQTGGTITVYGANFGTKIPAAPYRWDNFDSGTPGQSVSSGGWYTTASQPGKSPEYSTARTRIPGGQSCFQDFTGGNYNSTLGLTNLNVGKMYVSGWFYNTVSGAPTRNYKVISFRGGAPGEYDNPEGRAGGSYPDAPPGSGANAQLYAVDCDGVRVLSNWLDHTPMEPTLFSGAWHRLESWMDRGTVAGNNGSWRLLVDNSIWASIAGTFMRTTNCPCTNLYLMTYFATDEGTPQPAMEWYWDELYIDITQARVELGDASTWSSCTHKEIQIPSAWSPTAITLTANQGTFAPNTTAYVYVVDQNGVANNSGYPVTVGGTVIDLGAPGQPGQPHR